MKFCKLRVILQTSNKLKNYFRFKTFIPQTLQSNCMHKFSCAQPPTFVRPLDILKILQ